MSVGGWAAWAAAELGTNRRLPGGQDFYAIARTIEEHEIDGLLVIGGWAAIRRPPCLPSASLPGLQHPHHLPAGDHQQQPPGLGCRVGADTALNSIVDAVDKIKQSAVASRRCFVVEVMGRHCGYLALMSGLATGAERVYLHEEGVTLVRPQGRSRPPGPRLPPGKRLGPVIRNEYANPLHDAVHGRPVRAGGQGLFDVRQAILGHLQQGGNPTPFDRILATRLAAHSMDWLPRDQIDSRATGGAVIGMHEGGSGVRCATRRISPTGITGVRWHSGGPACIPSSTCLAAGSQRARPRPTSVDRLKRAHR